MAISGSDPFTTLPAELRVHILISSGSLSTVSRHSKSARQHMMKWLNSQFPDPLTDNDGRLTSPDCLKDNGERLASQLIKLHDQMIFYIEDYITKATAYYPSREYLCLPQIHDAHGGRYLMFKGTKVVPQFDSARLTALEKSRFIKAFLMYTLTRKCDSVLYVYPKLRPRKVTKAEEEACFCIASYFRSLYGAIFAQCTDDAWLPSNPSATSLQSGLLFPDNFYFEPDAYAMDMGFFTSRFSSFRNSFSAKFERLGPDRAADFLRLDMAKEDERKALKARLQDIQANEQPPLRWDSYYDLFKSGLNYKNGCESFIFEQLPLNRHDGLAWKVGKQRAWLFFDDRRFYPEETIARPNLPSEAFLNEQPCKQAVIEGWFNNPGKERALRRSQRWHDELMNTDK
ncbi:hypothetical protein EDB82DRAFT_553758 [Fusarium venenatum]|uniref:uncharacterized protein n=1 Tax=Fusarium venenatum TaxID=56646 RepID=UPI001DA09573|nr:hypothetical protein EDB82DRAFT_553758 [Fusarium venenatum]